MTTATVVWFRRDLRLHDHPALTDAAAHGPVAPLFVVDPTILHGRFASPNRAWFLFGAVDSLTADLAAMGVPLTVRVGRPVDVVPAFAREVGAGSVVASRDHAPYGRRRDHAVADRLAADGITFRPKRGTLIQEPESVLTEASTPFRLFTPFLRRWAAARRRSVLPAPSRLVAAPAIAGSEPAIPVGDRPDVLGLSLEPPTADPEALPTPGETAARNRLERWLTRVPDGGPSTYATSRDQLGDPDGTSRLAADLRFGLLSPVEVATRVLEADGGTVGSRRYVAELAWRDFYAHVLWHDPDVARTPFLHRFRDATWPGDPDDDRVAAWRAGRTGFPIVDAGMRQLLATGFMHNRARMVTASFLAKDLLIDWRIGEAHFMRHLIDGDPASNLGGWQWAASVGTDAQPYVRVFNPVTQGRRFDPEGMYVRRWVPELDDLPVARIHEPWTMPPSERADLGGRIGQDYPAPIVDHAAARERALAWYRTVARA